MKKIWMYAAACVLSAGMFAGCHKLGSGEQTTNAAETGNTTILNDYAFLITGSSIFVRRDGSVISADVSDFSKDYYDISEFENDYVAPEVVNYNKDKAGLEFSKDNETTEKLPVSIKGIEKAGDSIVLQLGYQTTEDYLNFSKQTNRYFADWNEFYVCEADKLTEHGIDANSVVAARDGSASSLSIIEDLSSYHACVLNYGGELPQGFSGKLQFQGEVMYATEGIAMDTAKENAVVTLSGDKTQIIIFK